MVAFCFTTIGAVAGGAVKEKDSVDFEDSWRSPSALYYEKIPLGSKGKYP